MHQESAGTMMSLAKTTRPRTATAVLRPRLFRILDRCATKPVTWVWAPPGSGKTTLIASYLAQQNLAHLWFQIDDGDHDLASFFYFLGLAAPKRRKPLPLLNPEYRQALPTFTRNFFRELFARFDTPVTMVFDNYQEISADSDLNRVMPIAIAELPPGARAIFISRSEPPANFAELRAKQAIELLDWGEIKFTRSEVNGLVRQVAPGRWPKEVIDQLHENADGWAAGLVLTMEQYRREGQADISKRGPSSQVLFDYFASEIFKRMDTEVKEMLLQTAFLTRITPAVAEKLTGSAKAGAFLSQLHRQNYFTSCFPGNEPRYEYHPLFRKFLLAEAERTFSPGRRAEICRRAAGIVAAAGRITAAARLYVESGDWRGFAALVRQHAQSLVNQGRLQTLSEWLGRIPESLLLDDPWLVYWRAVCHQSCRFAESRRDAVRAIEGFRVRKDAVGAYTAWSSAVFSILYEAQDAHQFDFWIALMEELRRDFPAFPSEEIEAHVACGMLVTITWRRLGHPDTAYWIDRGLELARRSPDALLRAQIFSTLAINFIARGDFTHLKPMTAELQEITREHAAPPLAQLAAHVGLSWLWLSGRHEVSARAVKNAHDTAQRGGYSSIVRGFEAHALLVALSQGDLDAARRWLANPLSPHDGVGNAYVLAYRIGVVWEALLKEEYERAAAGVEEMLRICETGWALDEASAKLVALQALHETGRTAEALTMLARVLDLAREMDSPFVEFMARLSQAQIAFDESREKEALEALRTGLSLGSKGGYRTSYGWRPTVMARLCARALGAGIEVDYVRDLIARRSLPSQAADEAEAWPWPVKIYTLGVFAIRKNDRPLTFAHKVQRKPLALLKAIISFGGKTVQEEALLDLLWPDADGDAARVALNSAIHRLRKLLGREEAIVREENRIHLNETVCWVDAFAVERLLKRAESRQPHEASWSDAVRAIHRAAALYHGPFLGEDTGAGPGLSDRLKRRLINQLIRVAAQAERREHWHDAATYYEQAFHIDPTAETACRRLMNLYHRLGRTADALSIYDQCRRSIQQQLGTTPSVETETLLKSIRPS